MSKTIHLIRHGQSTANAGFAETGLDPGVVDARLSELGEEQVRQTHVLLRDVHYDLIVASPLTRAIQTASGIFMGRTTTPMVIEPLHRELLGNTGDKGRAPHHLKADFPHLDFDHLPDVWWHAEGELDHRGLHIETLDVMAQRIETFKFWLLKRPEKRIAVVGHGLFFYHMTGVHFENCQLHAWQGRGV
jgi:glucosyl-3-phosphoglycerate phosphatase